jgi:hypothetical protein
MIEYRRSSFCSGGDCVEWAYVRSSYCHSGGCLEVAAHDGEVRIRDSKDPHSPVLRFTAEEWDAFLLGAKAGEFDVPEAAK